STGHRGGRRNLASHVRSNRVGGCGHFNFWQDFLAFEQYVVPLQKELCAEGGYMPQYFFSIRAGGDDAPAEPTAVLNDDAAALAYACEILRELMHSLVRTDRNSRVTVRDETRPMVLSIPFLAACA